MASKAALVAMLAFLLCSGGCKTFKQDIPRAFEKSFEESRPPARPLPLTADWPSVVEARLDDLYSEDSLNSVRDSFRHARSDAIVGWSVCVEPPDGAARDGYLRCTEPYARYQNIGLMLSEMHCGAFLAAIARAEAHQRFARETTSDLGTATSAVMGLLKNATGITSAVTTTFGLLENGFKNYQEAYLPSNGVRSGLSVFQQARLALLSAYQKDPPGSLAIAEYRINYYAASCSVDWMQRLIDASVVKAGENQGTNDLVIRMGGVAPPVPAKTGNALEPGARAP